MNVASAINGIRRRLQGPSVLAGRHYAQVIAIAAQKGGVGKTTTAVHLAVGLANQGQKTLLIDMDAQGHVATSLRAVIGRDGVVGPQESLTDLLLGKRRDLQEIARATSIDGLWIVESDTSLHETERAMSARIGKELKLRQALTIARTHYDTIIIDCPPNAGSLTVNALVAADRVLVPCDLALLSLDGVHAVLETIADVQDTLNPALELLGIVRTRVDRRNAKVNATIEGELARQFGDWIFDACIPTSTEVAKAQIAGRPVYETAPKCSAAIGYTAFTEEANHRIFGAGALRGVG